MNPLSRGALKGRVTMEDDGISIRDICIFEKDGRRWGSFPSRKYQKQDGTDAYWSYVFIEDKARYEKFQTWLIGQVEKKFPEAFRAEAPPPPPARIRPETATPAEHVTSPNDPYDQDIPF